MCLDYQLTKEKQEKLLKGKTRIACWKVVLVEENGRISPPYYNKLQAHYKQVNIEDNDPGEVRCPARKDISSEPEEPLTYTAYFHLYAKKADALKLDKACQSYKALKCFVETKDITTIGMSYGSLVIVTKKFTFIEGKEFFSKKKGNNYE